MKIRLLAVFIAVIQIQLIAAVVFYNYQKTEIVVVESERLFNDFKFKQEIERKLKGAEKAFKINMDSLKAISVKMREDAENMNKEELELISKEYKSLMNLIKERDENYSSSMQQAIQEYDSQIWEQLSSYLKSYAKENKVEVILGKDKQAGSGVLTNSVAYDRTDEILEYVNSKYKGK